MDPAHNDFWELAGGLRNARSRGRLGVGLLLSRVLAGAECEARSVEPGLIRRSALWPKALRATLGHTLSGITGPG